MCCSLFACNNKETTTANYEIVPKPLKTTVGEENNSFTLSKHTTISYPAGNEKLQKTAEFLAEYIQLVTGETLHVSDNIFLNFNSKETSKLP